MTDIRAGKPVRADYHQKSSVKLVKCRLHFMRPLLARGATELADASVQFFRGATPGLPFRSSQRPARRS